MLFTGNKATTTDNVETSSFNFRVTTLDGVDSDEDGIDPSCQVIVKYGDLPTSYVIGDKQVFNQSYPDVRVSLGGVFNFDVGYPESEYCLDSKTQKWVRKISQTVMNQQILPVYTSMETMDKTVHNLTVDDMKGITFQVIPQLYWKYEWTYNDFMIHRVGKLNAPSNEVALYDMLGNVWELVRDTYTISQGQTGPVQNPVGSTDSEDKTIRGGAFDQLIRKVISPSRENIDASSNKSEKATQPNVGFRPAMVFSAEGETSPDGPVDLFFLFDASASQDNQIKEMIR